MALFGMTAKTWRENNPDKTGNIRDYANVSQLVCLSNLESLNAVLINDGLEQSQRLEKVKQDCHKSNEDSCDDGNKHLAIESKEENSGDK